MIASATGNTPDQSQSWRPKRVQASISLLPEQDSFLEQRAQALGICKSRLVRELVELEREHCLVADAKVRRLEAAKRKYKKHRKL